MLVINDVLVTNDFHFMEGKKEDICQNILFYVSQEKVKHLWNDVKGSKSWNNFHFSVNYPLKLQKGEIIYNVSGCSIPSNDNEKGPNFFL